MSFSEFLLQANGFDLSPNTDTEAYADGATRTRNFIRKPMLPGTGNDQTSKLYARDSGDAGTVPLPASGVAAIDLQTALDARGNALALTDVSMLLLTHKIGSTASSISLQANAANGFTNLLGTAAALKVYPGQTIAMVIPTAAALVVSGTNKVLDLTNDDAGNVAEYRFEVWGR